MARLYPEKLHVEFGQGSSPEGPIIPRRYTLTHSDATGDLFLTVDSEYDKKQVSGLYTRFMRDEVLAEWVDEGGSSSLHVYCHVSGGLVLGRANWRESIFRREMPLVLEAFRYGDRALFESHPKLDDSVIWVHLQRSKRSKIARFGVFSDYRL
jgi:hypothetical protein